MAVDVTDRLRVRLLRPRLRVPLGIVVASVVSAVVFGATPFLVPAVSREFDVGIGAAGAISTSQLTGFVVASWAAGRFLRPRRRLLVAAAVAGSLANVSAAVTPWFAVLFVDRFVSGMALGLIAWMSWAEVFGDDERVGDVAVIGPIVGTISAPIIAVFLDRTGPDWLFLALAFLNLVPLLFIRSTRLDAAMRPRRTRHRPTRAAAVILVCLSMLTFGGSAVFVFAGAIGQEQDGLSPFAVSLAFSANALAAIPTARYRGTRKLAGLWMGITGVTAILTASVYSAPVFLVAMTAWGAAFWMGIPGAFALLAERSRYPEERAGDAQAVMALGRVFGPLVGGLLVSNASYRWLGAVAGGVMLLASAVLLYVEARIRQFPVYTSLQSYLERLAADRSWSATKGSIQGP
jgi:predicted MFS family arabinose efflux permease